jgi:hypothetical protein
VKVDTVSQPVGLLLFAGERVYELRATLAYDAKEPFEVRVLFPPGLEYLDLVLDRELLDQGLIGPATFGGIRVWPGHEGRWAVCLAIVTPAGDARFEAQAVAVQHFLNLTYYLVPRGTEPPRTDIDNVIAAILADGGAR